jgi:murein DD-endopeptidase MepM/ murein hydrolase activator NlpD
VVQPGDTLATIAARQGVAGNDLTAVNSAFLPSGSAIWPEMVLSIPRQLSFMPRRYENDAEDVNNLHVMFDKESRTINVRGRGQVVRLYDIARRVDRQYLREVALGQWYLAANLFIRAGVSLQITAPEATWLKLKSDAEAEVFLRTTNGQIIVEGAKITSWDEARGEPDMVADDGRSFIAATHGSRLDLINAEIAFLGDANEPALTWTTPEDEAGQHLLTGVVTGSSIHDTRGGAKVEGAVGMTWSDTVFRHNREK